MSRFLYCSFLERVGVFCSLGGNYRGSFALGLVQGEWKLYVKWPLDREEHNLYLINVTASDGLFVCHTVVQVTVVDANDNSPVCDKVSAFKKDVSPELVKLKEKGCFRTRSQSNIRSILCFPTWSCITDIL